MCGADLRHDHHGGNAETEDEYVLDTPIVRSFMRGVRTAVREASSPTAATEAVRPAFARLLSDGTWLPSEYRNDNPESGMGGGIGQWLLFRSAARDLCLFALVVPPGAATPVHDHLAWGLVGLYEGEQEETVFARRDEGGPVGDKEDLVPVTERTLRRGEFYALLPPQDDIHRVRTTSPTASVSIHLLTNDTGCVWRHSYDLETGSVSPFRSGYANWSCESAPTGV